MTCGIVNVNLKVLFLYTSIFLHFGSASAFTIWTLWIKATKNQCFSINFFLCKRVWSWWCDEVSSPKVPVWTHYCVQSPYCHSGTLALTTKAFFDHKNTIDSLKCKQVTDFPSIMLCIKTKALVGPVQQFVLEAVVGWVCLTAGETEVSSVTSHVTGEDPNFSGKTSDKIWKF